MSDKRPPIDVNRRALVSAFAVTGAASLVGAGRAAAQGVTTSTQTAERVRPRHPTRFLR